MTARWVVGIAPERDINIVWRTISLLMKNDPPTDSDYYEPAAKSHRMLRVLEKVGAAEGNEAVGKLYVEFGSRIHHDKELSFDIADALAAVGLDTAHAASADDESLDTAVRASMDDGLGLTGNDVGTPIIATVNAKGQRVAYFGPVITTAPDGEDALKLWDALMAMMDIDGFWELKRTRTEGPDFGERPTPL